MLRPPRGNARGHPKTFFPQGSSQLILLVQREPANANDQCDNRSYWSLSFANLPFVCVPAVPTRSPHPRGCRSKVQT